MACYTHGGMTRREMHEGERVRDGKEGGVERG